MITPVYEPALTVEAATDEWQAIRYAQMTHREDCDICTPDMAVCAVGQGLAELERAGWRLVWRARMWEAA